MATMNHQTVALSRGKHASPDEGACVMELASMLAGERFTDHPASVCPVIGAFLRTYNDSIDDDRRQDLYRYAAKVVGTSATLDIQAARSRRVAEAVIELRRTRRRWWHLPDPLSAFWCGRAMGLDTSFAVCEFIRAGRAGHAAALALVDDMVAIGAPPPSSLVPANAGAAAPAAGASPREVMAAGGALSA